ncbi:MAG: NAD(P)H-binding protein [Armatimonadaceae bacterium]
MAICIAAPTGNIGSRVVQLLIQAGVRPTIIARNPDRLDSAVRETSDVRQGNLMDTDFVLQATRDADALFWLIPTNYVSHDPLGEMIQMGEVAAKAIHENGIKRTVFLSSAGAERRGKKDPIGTLGQVEDILNATGGNILCLRPGYFYTNLLMDVEPLQQGVLPTMIPLDVPMPWNDPRDIGDIVAARLLHTDWTGQTVQKINGPRHLTYAEVASIISEVTGHAVQAIRVTGEETRSALLVTGMSPAAADAMVQMSVGLEDIASDEYAPTFVSTTPSPLEGWCYANLRPVLRSPESAK